MKGRGKEGEEEKEKMRKVSYEKRDSPERAEHPNHGGSEANPMDPRIKEKIKP